VIISFRDSDGDLFEVEGYGAEPNKTIDLRCGNSQITFYGSDAVKLIKIIAEVATA
jgi:hypothetical protein